MFGDIFYGLGKAVIFGSAIAAVKHYQIKSTNKCYTDDEDYTKVDSSCFVKIRHLADPLEKPDAYDVEIIKKAYADKGFRGKLYINFDTNLVTGNTSFYDAAQGKTLALLYLDRREDIPHTQNVDQYSRQLYAIAAHEASHVVQHSSTLDTFLICTASALAFNNPLIFIPLSYALHKIPVLNQPTEIAADIGAAKIGATKDLANYFESEEKELDPKRPIQWLSTHPDNRIRSYYLNRLHKSALFPNSPNFFQSAEYKKSKEEHSIAVQERLAKRNPGSIS